VTSGEKSVLAIALVIAIAVGGYTLYVSMNRKDEPAMNRGSDNDGAITGGLRNSENTEIVVRETANVEPSEFITWYGSLSDTYQNHIRGLDGETKQWLQGMSAPDRMSYLRRAVRNGGYDISNSNTDTGLAT